MSDQAQVEITAQDSPLDLTDHESYEAVIEKAFAVYVDRERIRHGLWKQYPPIDQARQVKIKADRVMHTLERPSDGADVRAHVLEEMLDIINYAVFTVRLLEGTA